MEDFQSSPETYVDQILSYLDGIQIHPSDFSSEKDLYDSFFVLSTADSDNNWQSVNVQIGKEKKLSKLLISDEETRPMNSFHKFLIEQWKKDPSVKILQRSSLAAKSTSCAFSKMTFESLWTCSDLFFVGKKKKIEI